MSLILLFWSSCHLLHIEPFLSSSLLGQCTFNSLEESSRDPLLVTWLAPSRQQALASSWEGLGFSCFLLT